MTDGLPPQPNTQADEFRCPQCGGKMDWDAASSAMLCQHCSHKTEVSESEGSKSIVEHDLEHGLAKTVQRGLGAPVKTITCNECGATVSFDATATVVKCDFCDSSHVMQQEENRNNIRPESLVPFRVERNVANDKFAGWLKGLWFRPGDLKSRAKIDEMNGVYVPYWTFDATVDSDWTAQAGYYYYVTESYTDTDANGNTVSKTRQVRKTDWRWASGDRRDAYDDVLICASKGLPAAMADKLTTFDTMQLLPYEPGYLSGWKAEEYAIDLNDAWGGAVGKMEASQRSRCSSDVPGDTQRFLNVTNRFSEETFKHVLLPIWISSYRYKEAVYRFLVNGQTGEVTGKAPYSVIKIILFVLMIVAIIVGIVLLVQHSN